MKRLLSLLKYIFSLVNFLLLFLAFIDIMLIASPPSSEYQEGGTAYKLWVAEYHKEQIPYYYKSLSIIFISSLAYAITLIYKRKKSYLVCLTTLFILPFAIYGLIHSSFTPLIHYHLVLSLCLLFIAILHIVAIVKNIRAFIRKSKVRKEKRRQWDEFLNDNQLQQETQYVHQKND